MFFLAACNKKFQRANATDIAKDGNDPPDDWLKTGSARDSLSGLSWIHSLICITRSLENNAFSVLYYVMFALLCYIDSRFFLPLEQSRTAPLGCHLAASRLREAARWQQNIFIIFCGVCHFGASNWLVRG